MDFLVAHLALPSGRELISGRILEPFFRVREAHPCASYGVSSKLCVLGSFYSHVSGLIASSSQNQLPVSKNLWPKFFGCPCLIQLLNTSVSTNTSPLPSLHSLRISALPPLASTVAPPSRSVNLRLP